MSSIVLQPHAEGLVLAVKAQPGARRNELRGVQDGALKVCVTQVAEGGKANEAIREQLAKSLKLKRSQIELIAGMTNPQKRFLIRNIAEPELLAKLAEYL